MMVDMGKRGPKPSSEFREQALALRLEGRTFAEIAAALGLSRQRVQQILSPPRAIRDRIIISAQGLCEQCGLFVGTGGHVHHRQAKGAAIEDYNDEPNLCLLCPSCHRKAHKAVPLVELPQLASTTGAELTARRDALGLSQRQLAEVLGVHPTTVNRWEHDVQPISRIVVLAMRGLLCEQECRRTPAHTFIPLSGSQGPDGQYQRCGVDGCLVAPEHHRRASSTAAEEATRG